MAVVIASDESTHFAPSLRRSHSQPKFGSKQSGFHQSSSTSRISDLYQQSTYQQQPVRRVFSGSPDLTAPPSPHVSSVSDGSFTVPSPAKSALAPSLRLPERLDRSGFGTSPSGIEESAVLGYAHYDGVSYFNPAQDLASAHEIEDLYAASPNDNNTVSTGPSRTNSSDFDFFDHIAEDDTAVRAQPSRHVDYLSHNWREEDIWESWKYIVSRRGDYSNSARLENASWRTWMKSKNKLKTISPETLNWLKDCDVTWLYGPLQTGHQNIASQQAEDSVELTKSNSFLVNSKKPILKKRSMSELMLQRSLSASSLVKQAAAAVQAQQKDKAIRRITRPRLERATTDYITFPFSSRRHSPGTSSLLLSISSSGVVSPSSERRHIHFNEQVEQCIVVEVKGDDDDDESAVPRYESDSSDSDDGAIMMKRTALKRRAAPRHRQSHPIHTESKTIAMLPSTKLKAQEDDPDILEGSAMKHSYRSPIMSPSSSQETLRPSKPSSRMFFGSIDEYDAVDRIVDIDNKADSEILQVQKDEDEDEDDSEDEGLGMSMANSRKRTSGFLSTSASTSKLSAVGSGPSTSFSSSSGGGLKRTTSTSSLFAEPAGMRRTASGMFMPYEEGETAIGRDGGVIGRVIDTVNTARDIIHVIMNVGWKG
ncbi:protein phosphatase type 1 complex subunit hex2 [Grosmannia clavigera kw1407]|uniref:Protein phosphatase type 1 complex subunit hex2 n=1 Tax=Grosmannia clavigera (strain kw1407 / UAMH 11150) TaxID=655863 RepID=F0XHC2_GROCL|nr:protein phosphatase type 1 complex subunit hex2 [Grosmannia clavigera kw1407]EFX03024.1 protein phosphatase type 1 complex subunit hex2 [Grosmannia clavigera kw1407]